jgi:murein DD-endopeptidase MepM/ murein hydrolase activator NlpD
VTIVVHRDGDLASRSYRFPLWIARTVVAVLVGIGVLVLLGAVLYAPIVRTAASVPGLKSRVARLEAENAQVQELARTLNEAEQRYEQIRGMLGGNVVPPLPATPTDGRLPVAAAILAVRPDAAPRFETGPSVPSHWPLIERGVITRGQVSPGVGDETHTGLDIAVPTGTAIRASGGGVVSETGEDAEYGTFVILDHPEGYQTLYGHASRLLVSIGDSVDAGQVIALSGSTGRSTGPHLHFEVRRGGQALDPRTVLEEVP